MTFPQDESIIELIRLAKREDLGPQSDDVTSRLLVGADEIGVGTVVMREQGISAGLPIVQMICQVYDERLRVEQIPGFHFDVLEGRYNDQSSLPLMRLRGPKRSLLSAERVILNFLQRICGVASLTHRFVRRAEGTRARIVDTRKTIPGFRLLDKYAVVAGGGLNHRIGLYDGLLVKDNHIASVPIRQLTEHLNKIVQNCRRESSSRLVEVEVDTLAQFREVLKVPGIDVILLDNMDCPQMTEAVGLRDAAGSSTRLEASGGITLQTVRQVAETGVDRIAVGALTHSAPALDIALDIEQ